MKGIIFFPTNILGKFNELEVHPCMEVEPGIIEQVEPEDAEFWSVYIRYDPTQNKDNFGGLDCIADCGTKEEADGLVEFLKQFIHFGTK